MCPPEYIPADPVTAGGTFKTAAGPILSGESTTFTFNAVPGDMLQIATMFVQSNDWFYAFGDGGLDLFNGDTPVSGDVTSSIVLYDAGTEEDTAAGTGADQKPAQAEGEVNVGRHKGNDYGKLITIGSNRPTRSPPREGIARRGRDRFRDRTEYRTNVTTSYLPRFRRKIYTLRC